MDINEAIKNRHAVRAFNDKPLENDAVEALKQEIDACNKESGEKRYLVVALGYGETSGTVHKIKSIQDVSDYKEGDPDWYKNGIEAALLAPTAMNQQKFKFERNGEKVSAKAGLGFYTKIDLGIAKYHFEVGSGKGKDVWELK